MLSLGWYGGKKYLVARLIPLIPEHRVYVEVFGGGAALLLNKSPSPVEVYNDIDQSLVNFFRVLKHPEKFERLLRFLALTPHSRYEHEYACLHYSNPELDDVERAALFYIAVYQSMNGIPGSSWSRTTWESRRGMALKTSAWLGAVDRLPEIAERLLHVQIENRSFEDILAAYDTPDTFFYLDPPYLPDTRRQTNVYPHEMTIDQHIRMLELVQSVRGKVMLSGYPNPLYDRYLSGWCTMDFQVACRSTVGATAAHGSHRKSRRTERLWMNYESSAVGLFSGVEECANGLLNPIVESEAIE